jgi:ParB/RepB/Spo0J family partition protein
MRGTTMSKTATKTHVPNLAKLKDIKVDFAKNPRGDIGDITELTASVKEIGVVQPVVCVVGADGLELVAGYRRYAAAKAAGLDEIPYHIRGGETREEDAIAENLPGLRQDMTEIAEARAMKQLAQTKHLNQKQLAKRMGKSPSFVAERFRLLRLPEVVQEVYTTGRPGIAVAPALEKIGKVSPSAAARIAVMAAENPEAEKRLRESPGYVVEQLSRVLAEERGTVKGPDEKDCPRPPADGELVAVSLGYHHGVDLFELALTDEKRDELGQRMEALSEQDSRFAVEGEGFEFAVAEEDIDALRALGVLLEYGREDDDFYYGASRFCFDSAALVDRLELLLAAAEQDAKTREAEELKAAEEQAKKAGEELPKDVDPAQLRAEKEKEKRAKELADEKEEKKEARRLNLDLGRRLLKRRARKRSQKRRRELIRGLALMAVMADEHLAGLGPRLAYETWQEVEHKKLKSGKTKEIVTYLEPHKATGRLLRDLESAKTEDEILDIIGDALVAAKYGSEKELPMSRRVCGYSGSLRFGNRGVIRRAIDIEAEGALPPELRKALEKSKKTGYEDRFDPFRVGLD